MTRDMARMVFSASMRTLPPPPRVRVLFPDLSLNNPAAIVDAQTGDLHFIYRVDYYRCFYMVSKDDGLTFSDLVEFTETFERFRSTLHWKVIATGPGHGIQLANGRLILPVWLARMVLPE